MTEPIPPARNGDRAGRTERMLLLLILAAAAAIRIKGVGFGLPALNDPDEPLFMMTAIDMLRGHSLNPGWFGHPATLTFYALAIVALAVGGIGILTGRFANADAFVGAVYADPAILWVPARLFFVACGVLCVLLTYWLGKRLGSARLGLVAAALLAVNAVHVEYSQLIRTDVQASVFMLLCILASLAILRTGRPRDHLLAGLFVGLGVATKWPSAIIALSPLCASVWHNARKRPALAARGIALIGVAAALTLFIASPYLLLDYQTVVQNLSGEARPAHPGATGGGLIANLGWYIGGPLLRSFGLAGLILAGAGAIMMPLRSRETAVAILPGFAALAFILGAQSLVWERWIVPLLPFLALTAAWMLCAIADFVQARSGRALKALEALLLAPLLIPMLQATLADQAERGHDTRQIAAAWVRANVPPGKSILVEHAALDLLEGGRWPLLFPLGTAGCIDARKALSGRIKYSDVETARAGGPLVDIGYVPPARLASCRADYAIFTHFHIYAESPETFAAQAAAYRAVAAGGRVRAIIRPRPGMSGGPVVQIVQLAPAS